MRPLESPRSRRWLCPRVTEPPTPLPPSNTLGTRGSTPRMALNFLRAGAASRSEWHPHHVQGNRWAPPAIVILWDHPTVARSACNAQPSSTARCPRHARFVSSRDFFSFLPICSNHKARGGRCRSQSLRRGESHITVVLKNAYVKLINGDEPGVKLKRPPRYPD